MTQESTTTPEPTDPLPRLVGAIVDAHLSGWLDTLHDVVDGQPRAEVLARTLARTLARREAIRAEVVEPYGAAGRAAWEEAAPRMLEAVAVIRKVVRMP